MTDAPDERLLARDMIEVHETQAATVARDNARAPVLARRSPRQVVDNGAWHHPTPAG